MHITLNRVCVLLHVIRLGFMRGMGLLMSTHAPRYVTFIVVQQITDYPLCAFMFARSLEHSLVKINMCLSLTFCASTAKEP